MMKIGYMVVTEAFEYNDEYFSSFEGASNFESRVYTTRERAEERADAMNFEHASEVTSNLREWCYGAGLSDMGGSNEDLRWFYAKAFPGEAVPEEIQEVKEKVDDCEKVELDDDDLREFIARFPWAEVARVEEVEIETDP